MPTDFHVRVRRILEVAVRTRPEARERFLRQTCAADTRLLREVRSLLPHFAEMRDFEPQRPGGRDWQLPGTTTFLKLRTEVGAADPSDSEPQPPFSIDQYTAVEVLGRGGMGVVYLGEQASSRRVVAVKLLRRGLVSPQDRCRFMFEEEILRQLRHPGIARFSHSGLARLRRPRSPCGQIEERPYYVMEYVAGQPLTRYAAEQGLSVPQRLALLVRVCEAVEYAHHRGIVHCDLKPDNILVSPAGQPKVLDFGISRLVGFEALGRAGQDGVAGTLPYASPEQLAGRGEQITPSSDVYALGLIAHELLAGARPGREGWAVHLRLDQMRVDGRTAADGPRNCEFRYYLHGILATALRQSRGQLYGGAGELGADLESLLVHFPVLSRWAAFKARFAGRATPLASWAPGTLARPLSVVLRKRIGLALAAGRGESPAAASRAPGSRRVPTAGEICDDL